MAENTITDLEGYYDSIKDSGIFSEEAQSSFDPTFGFTGSSADATKAFAENSNLSNETGPSDGIPRSSAPFRYPYTKIDEHDDYMKLEIVEFVAPGLDRISDNELSLKTSDHIAKKDILYTIMLPVPQGLEDTKGANWSDGNIGPAEAMIASVVKKGMTTDGSIASMAGGAFSELQSQLTQLGQADRSVVGNMLTGTTASLVANALTGSGANFFGRETGLTVNKNQQLLFDGITGRNFSFSWDMVPRNNKEADQIKIIIRILKQAMSPQRGGTATVKGLFLKSPDIFYLTYMHGKDMHPFLNAFKPCALTGLSVNYTGSGTYATYRDGTPVHLSLSLNFAELTAVYRDDYAGPNSGDGVGY